MKTPVIGIDLGTTNTCVAVVKNKRPVVIPTLSQKNTFPSMVALKNENAFLVGEDAKRQVLLNAERTFHSTKRLLGRAFNDPIVQSARERLSYPIVETAQGGIATLLNGQTISLEAITARILEQARQLAQNYLDQEISRCVITVPAYFSNQQRSATLDAAKIAGLKVIRLVNEPTAAAIAYGYNKKRNKILAIYDLGGGTFDFTVLELIDGIFRVLATSGDTYLGGDDIDHLLTQKVRTFIMGNYGVDPDVDRIAMQRIRNCVEQAKKDLSTYQEIEIQLPFLKIGRHESINFTMRIKRKELEQLCVNAVEKTLECCQRCLSEGDISKSQIDDIMLVGGQSRMPWINDRVSNFFGRTVSSQLNADEVVAMGAAILGAALSKNMDSELLLVDVLPQALGIRSAGDTFSPIIKSNTSIPTEKTKVFTNIEDNQDSVKVEVYQGSSKRVSENRKLGELSLTKLKPAKAGDLSIEVRFAVDSNGILSVNAVDQDTGQTQSVRLDTHALNVGTVASERDRLKEEPSVLVRQTEATRDMVTEVTQLLSEVKTAFEAKKTHYDAEQIKKAEKIFEIAPAFIASGEAWRIEKIAETLQILKDQLSS